MKPEIVQQVHMKYLIVKNIICIEQFNKLSILSKVPSSMKKGKELKQLLKLTIYNGENKKLLVGIFTVIKGLENLDLKIL